MKILTLASKLRLQVSYFFSLLEIALEENGFSDEGELIILLILKSECWNSNRFLIFEKCFLNESMNYP